MIRARAFRWDPSTDAGSGRAAPGCVADNRTSTCDRRFHRPTRGEDLLNVLEVTRLRSRILLREAGHNGAVTPLPHEESLEAVGQQPQEASIDYRSGDLENIEDVARLVHDVYGGDLANWRANMSRALERPSCCLVLAQHQGVAVGYGMANSCEPTSAEDQAPAGYYLTGLIVQPAWRRDGTGTELTRRRRAWIWSLGQPAWFFTNARNQASLALHDALGFTEVARAASYLGEPFDGGVGVLMRADPPVSTRARR